MQLKSATYVLLILAALSAEAAHAYIDPGTGSMLIQGIIAAIAAVGVTLKLYWHRFVGLFRKDRRTKDNSSKNVRSDGVGAREE